MAGAVIGAVIGGGAAAAGSAFFGATFLASVFTGASLGNMYDQYKAAKEAEQSREDSLKLSNTNTISESVPVALIYGTCRVAGNIIYDSSNGDKDGAKDMIWCVGLGEGEISAVRDVKINDELVSEYRGCSYTAHLGINNQVADSRNSDENYTNTAYLALTLHASDDLTGTPTITSIVDGLMIYVWNPITSTMVKQFSRNPVWILYDIMTNKRYGCGIDPSKINVETFKTCAAYCDEVIDYVDDNGVSGTEPRFVFDGVITDTTDADQLLASIASTFHGFLIKMEGTYKVRLERAELAVQTFVEGESIISNSIAITRTSKLESPNRIIVQYTDPVHWDTDEYIIDEEDDIVKRGLRDQTISFVGVKRRTQASRTTNYIHDMIKLCPNFVEFKVPFDRIEAEPGDVVKISHSLGGYINKLLRIITIELDEKFELKLMCREYDPEVYVDDPNKYYVDSISTFSYSALTPPDVLNLDVDEHFRDQGNGVVISDLYVAFNAPSREPIWESADIYMLTDDPAADEVPEISDDLLDTVFDELPSALGVWKFVGNVKSGIIIRDVTKRTTYSFKVLSLSSIGRRTLFSKAPSFNYTVKGKSLEPFTPTGVGIEFTDVSKVVWDMPEQSDIDFTEVRLDGNFGTDNNRLAKVTNNNIAIVYLLSRIGTIYVAHHNTAGYYSRYVKFEYNKQKLLAPLNLNITRVFQGLIITCNAPPIYCGINFHTNDGSGDNIYSSVNNSYPFKSTGGIYDIQVAYTDLFGECELSDILHVTIVPTIDPILIKAESLSLDMMNTTIKDAVAKAQVSIDETTVNDAISDLDTAKVSHTEFNSEVNVLAQADTDNRSLISQKAGEIDTIVGTLAKAPDAVGQYSAIASVNQTAQGVITTLAKAPDASGQYSAITQLKILADGINSTVQSYKITQDGTNTGFSNSITQNYNTTNAIITELGKSLATCSYTAISQALSAINLRAVKANLISQINLCPEAITIASKFNHVAGDTLFDDNVIISRMLAADSITADKIKAGEISIGKIDSTFSTTINNISSTASTGVTNAATAQTYANNAYNYAQNSVLPVASSAKHYTDLWAYDATYMNGAQIYTGTITANKLNVSSLDAICGTLGTFQSATTGARTVITSSLITVYDANNVLRVKMGVW